MKKVYSDIRKFFNRRNSKRWQNLCRGLREATDVQR